MVALRASAVPLPGKNSLQPEVRFVNPYSGKGMNKSDFWLFHVSAGEAALLPKNLILVRLADLVIQLV